MKYLKALKDWKGRRLSTVINASQTRNFCGLIMPESQGRLNDSMEPQQMEPNRKCTYCTFIHQKMASAHSMNFRNNVALNVKRIPVSDKHLKDGLQSKDFSFFRRAKSEDKIESDHEDHHIRPALEAHMPDTPQAHSTKMVPGKGPPPEPPVDCCMSGCANCLWIQYAEDLKDYFSEAESEAILKKAIEEVDHPGLKWFLKVEMKLV